MGCPILPVPAPYQRMPTVAILHFWPGSRLDKSYSKALGWMITGFLIMFTLALIGHILVGVIGV